MLKANQSERRFVVMPTIGTSSTGGFACAVPQARTLRDLKTKRRGQPVYVLGHLPERKGQEATFELFNVRLAVVKFEDGETIGYDPVELLLPTEIDEKSIAYYEIRQCVKCGQQFVLTAEEATADEERTACPDCEG
jgi:DNA-directed RNA polymerase subunit RPC12/RpoP